MFDIGLSEILVILIVALIVIGPQKLPDVARALGRGLSEFRRALDDMKEELNTDRIRTEANEMKDSLLFGKGFKDEEKAEPAAGETAPVSEPDGKPGRTDQEGRPDQEPRAK